MRNEDDIIDLILSGQNYDDFYQKEEEDYTQDSPSLNLESKNTSKEQALSTTINETQNNNNESSEKASIKEDNKNIENKKENEEIKKKKLEENKIDEFFPQFKNPLDFVKYLEIDRVNKDILNEMQNFILEKHRKKDNKYEISEIKSLLQINNEIANININLMFLKKDLLLFYTKNGNILIFSLKGQNFIKSIVPKSIKNSNINCMDMTNDLQEIICGYGDGTVAVINIQNGDTKYVTNKIHKDCACIELKLYKKDKEKNELYFISSGSDGQVFYNIIKLGMSIFSKVNSDIIISKNNLQIFMIKNILNFNLSENYALLGSFEEIHLYVIEPNIDLLFSIKKPKFIIENVAPDAQVGKGGLPQKLIYGKIDDYNNLLLIISWGNIINFYQLKTKKNMINNYNIIGNYVNTNNILRIGFMNNSVVYCLDEAFSIKFLNTSKINSEDIELSKENQRPIIPKKNFGEIEENHFIFPPFVYQEKVNIKSKLGKSYLYSIIENEHSLFTFGKQQINKIELIDWEVFLNTFKKKEDFLNLFSVGVEIYKGKFHALSNIPPKDILTKMVGNFLKQIISHYVIVTMGEKKSGINFLEKSQDKEKIIQCLKLTIESCIEIEAVEFLLSNIEPLFEEKEYSVLFVEKLIPFVLRDKLKDMILSKDLILNLLDLYYRNGKQDYLSQMLLHFNIKSLDSADIRDKLEKMNLTIPLAYLYINGESQDYLEPLQKMFEYFCYKANSSKILIENEENNSVNYSNVLNNKLINLEDILNCKEYAGHRILWYIRWILSGKKFPDEQNIIELNIFEKLVPKITYWLLNERVISEFLNFDPKYYFMIYKNIFSSKKNVDFLTNYANDSKIKISTLASLLTTVNSISKLNDIYPSSLINYMYSWCKYKNEKKIYFFFYDFIIVISNIININKELKIESVCFILSNYKQIVKPINNLEIQHLNRQIIDFLNNKNIFTDANYSKILCSIVDHTFDEVKLFLYQQMDEYKECIEFYLDKNSILNDKYNRLFKWINKLIDELKNTYKYNNFIEAIKRYLFDLAKASINDFFELSKKIFWNERKEVIENLSKDQNIQLNYIELLIKSMVIVDEANENLIYINEEDEEIVNYIFGKHIFLLCQLKRFDEIVPALKSNSFYPLEQCLIYCKNSDAYEGCIYLYLKEDAIENAFGLSKSYLENIFQKLINNINNENNSEIQNKLLNDFEKYLNDCKTICEHEYNPKESEEIWFRLLQILYNHEKTTENQLKKFELDENKYKSVNELYQRIIQDIKELLEKMCSYVSITRIMEVVTEKNKNAGFKEFRELLIKLLGNYDNLSNIFISARRLLTNLVLENENKFQTYNSKGDLLKIEKCDKCLKTFTKNLNNKEKILLFSCNHKFHRSCVKDQRTEFGKEPICPICSELEISNSENKGESLIRKNTTIIEGDKDNENNKFQVNVSFSSRKMLQTLKIFDTKYFEKRKVLTDSIDD